MSAVLLAARHSLRYWMDDGNVVRLLYTHIVHRTQLAFFFFSSSFQRCFCFDTTCAFLSRQIIFIRRNGKYTCTTLLNVLNRSGRTPKPLYFNAKNKLKRKYKLIIMMASKMWQMARDVENGKLFYLKKYFRFLCWNVYTSLSVFVCWFRANKNFADGAAQTRDKKNNTIDYIMELITSQFAEMLSPIKFSLHFDNFQLRKILWWIVLATVCRSWIENTNADMLRFTIRFNCLPNYVVCFCFLFVDTEWYLIIHIQRRNKKQKEKEKEADVNVVGSICIFVSFTSRIRNLSTHRHEYVRSPDS